MPPFPYALKIADLVWLPTTYPLTEKKRKKSYSRPSTPTLILDSRTRIRSILLGFSNSRDHKVTVAPTHTYLSDKLKRVSPSSNFQVKKRITTKPIQRNQIGPPPYID